MRPELRRVEQVITAQLVLLQHRFDVARFGIQRERRRRMRQYLNAIACDLIEALDLEPPGVSAGDDERRAPQILAVKSLALSPRSARGHFRKPWLQAVLKVPNDRHVRQ